MNVYREYKGWAANAADKSGRHFHFWTTGDGYVRATFMTPGLDDDGYEAGELEPVEWDCLPPAAVSEECSADEFAAAAQQMLDAINQSTSPAQAGHLT